MFIMKHTLKTLIIFLLITFKVSAQGPALTIPDFSFFKLDKSLFTNKNIEPGKMLFFFFFDADCNHCQHAMMNLNQHYPEYKKAAIYLIIVYFLPACFIISFYFLTSFRALVQKLRIFRSP